MSEKATALLDVYRLAHTGRGLSGVSPVSAFARLKSLLASDAGELRWSLDFGIDELSAPYCDVNIDGSLFLQCQRTLDTFEYGLAVATRLALVKADDDGTGSRYEPLLVDPAGMRALQIVEDELILAIPLVPVAPGTEPVVAASAAPGEGTVTNNPFAVLNRLKLPN